MTFASRADLNPDSIVHEDVTGRGNIKGKFRLGVDACYEFFP